MLPRLSLQSALMLAVFAIWCAQTAHDADPHPTPANGLRGDQTMRAIGLYQYGGPDVLGIVTIENPHPAPTEVRVRVMAAGVNPVDEMVRSGKLAAYYKGQDFPFVPGMDISGVVEDIGLDVDPELGLGPGMEVTGLVSNFAGYGGYSKYIRLPARSVIPKPNNISYVEASAFMMPALTARAALDELRLPAGSSVAVIGAAGAVGAFACILAHRDGLEVVGIASPSDEQALRTFGVTRFVPRGADANDRIREMYPLGVDAVIDTAGIRERAFPAIKDGGRYIALRTWNDAPSIRGMKVDFVNVRDRIEDHEAIAEIGRLVELGVLPIRIAGVFPASQAAAAHRLLEANGVRGRVVIDMTDLSGPPAPRPD